MCVVAEVYEDQRRLMKSPAAVCDDEEMERMSQRDAHQLWQVSHGMNQDCMIARVCLCACVCVRAHM